MTRWDGTLQGARVGAPEEGGAVTQGTPELSRVARILLDREASVHVADKVLSGERRTLDEGVQLLKSNDLVAIGALANWVRERLHGDLTYFNRSVHINATNVCEATCIFCAVLRLKTGDPAAYTTTLEQAVGRVRALRDVLITEVHIVNGLNPDLLSRAMRTCSKPSRRSGPICTSRASRPWRYTTTRRNTG